MPSTIYLIYFEGLLDDDFLLQCMDYFIENSPRVYEVAKEARESFIESITGASAKTKKPSKKRIALKKILPRTSVGIRYLNSGWQIVKDLSVITSQTKILYTDAEASEALQTES